MFQTAKKQIFLITFGSLLAGFSLASIIVFTDPYDAGSITHIFLYVSTFLLSLGFFTLLGLVIRHYTSHAVHMVNMGNSFRQAFLISTLICASLFLQSQDLLFWWVEASLILFFIAIEAFLNLKV